MSPIDNFPWNADWRSVARYADYNWTPEEKRPVRVFTSRPKHAKMIGTSWHAGLTVALAVLTVAAAIGWFYHQKSQSWS